MVLVVWCGVVWGRGGVVWGGVVFGGGGVR